MYPSQFFFSETSKMSMALMDFLKAFREKTQVEGDEEEKELVSFETIPDSDRLADLEISTLLNE